LLKIVCGLPCFVHIRLEFETPGVEDEYILMTHVYNIGKHCNMKVHSECFDSVVNITWN